MKVARPIGSLLLPLLISIAIVGCSPSVEPQRQMVDWREVKVEGLGAGVTREQAVSALGSPLKAETADPNNTSLEFSRAKLKVRGSVCELSGRRIYFQGNLLAEVGDPNDTSLLSSGSPTPSATRLFRQSIVEMFGEPEPVPSPVHRDENRYQEMVYKQPHPRFLQAKDSFPHELIVELDHGSDEVLGFVIRWEENLPKKSQ